MQTALFLTDCSVDSALSLRRWQTENSHISLRITVVHPYDIEPRCLSTKESSRARRQEVHERLQNWRAMVPQSESGSLHSEILLGSASLVLTLHLRLRHYDYLLLSDGQDELTAASNSCMNQVSTKLILVDQPWKNHVGQVYT